MRPNCCLAILCVSIFASLILTLDAIEEDPDCDIEVKVRRNTVNEAVLGEDLRINCTVEFCSDPPPPVSWYKQGTTTAVPVNVSSSSHIKTEWKPLKHLVGTAFLIFQNVRRNDSGVYQCGSGGSVSHNINVSVHGVGERPNVTRNNDTGELTTDASNTSIWAIDKPMVYIRAFGVLVLVLMVFFSCVASCCGSKDKSRDAPSRQPSHDALPSSHIYENDQ